jgi:hypothetical protein
MNSLVDAPVLGFDLARAPHGAQLAAVLRRCLAIGPAQLPLLAAGHRSDPARDDAWREVGLAATSAPGLGRVVAVAGQALAGGAGGAALGVLSVAPLGTLETLLRCVRHDVLGWTWTRSGEVAVQDDVAARASAVVCDAVAAAALPGSLGAAAAQRLAGPWLAAAALLPDAADDVGPCSDDVRALLTQASVADRAVWTRLVAAAAPDSRTAGRWADAVHTASWAVYLAGRVRAAATAQLLLVEAVHAAGAPAEMLAQGAWRVLSGAVQAAVVQDVLDERTSGRLLDGCRRALRPVT